MISICDGERKLIVTKSAFEEFYKKAGWVKVNKNVQEDVEETSSADIGITKPMSEMTSDELKEYAESLGIDVSEMRSRKEIKAAIKELM